MSIQYVDLVADLIGTIAGTFNISGANDQVSLSIDGGSPQLFTLTHGVSQTAANVVTDLVGLTGAVAYAIATGPQANKVRIQTVSALGAGSSILVNAPSNNANTALGFSAGTVTGFPRQNVMFSSPLGTKQELINEIETVLLAAGWTTVSGHGTTNLLMQSAVTPPGQNLQMNLRVKGTNTNCVSISIENVVGTKVGTNSTTGGAQLLPALSKTWLFVANKYQCCIRTPVVSIGREFAFFGVPALPSFLQGVVTEAIHLHGNTEGDTDATLRSSFRTNPYTGASTSAPYWCGICNGNLFENISRNNPDCGDISLWLVGQYGVYTTATVGYRWHDGSAFVVDAVIGWGLTGVLDEWKARGILWDACCVTESYVGDTVATFDGRNWVVITDTWAGGAAISSRQVLLLVTS